MNKVLLIVGLTILYYAILIYWDRKKRAAFKLAQKKIIGETTPIPIVEKTEVTTELFGATNLTTNSNPIGNQAASIKTEGLFEKLELTDNHLENDLEDLALDLAAEQTIETPKDTLMQDLAATTKDELNEKDIASMVAKISRRKP